jgi:hypothetical protein
MLQRNARLAVVSLEIDFNGRVHAHSGSNQARGEKAGKAARKVTAPIGWSSGRCKSVGPRSGERSSRREEALFVGCWSSGDFKGNEEALGEGQSASEEGGVANTRKQDARSRVLLFGVGAPGVVHPATQVFGQHARSTQQACQHTESHGGTENKKGQTSDTQCGKHKPHHN